MGLYSNLCNYHLKGEHKQKKRKWEKGGMDRKKERKQDGANATQSMGVSPLEAIKVLKSAWREEKRSS